MDVHSHTVQSIRRYGLWTYTRTQSSPLGGMDCGRTLTHSPVHQEVWTVDVHSHTVQSIRRYGLWTYTHTQSSPLGGMDCGRTLAHSPVH